MSGYQEALEAAGATVIVFKEFGSYQGEWWAKAAYNGETGWVSGSYGSCSGCDAFQSEFGYSGDERCPEHEHDYAFEGPCTNCDAKKAAMAEKLAAFGKTYLDGLMAQDRAESAASENLDWDSEAGDMLDFIRSNA